MVRSDLRERFEEALSRGSLGETAIPVRFFSKYEIDQAVAFARASAAQPENGSGVSVGPEVTSPSATDGATGPTGGAPTGSAPGAVLPTNLPGGIQASPRNAGEPELLPPMGVVAQAADDGVRIAWADDPGNLRQLPGSTSVALLRTEIWRWIGSGVPKLIAVVPLASDSSANPPSNPMPSDPARPESRPSGSESTIPIRTFVDREPCAGMRVLYALRTVQIDRVEGVEVRHSASSPPAPVTIPIRFEVQPLRFVESSESRLAVRIVDRRRTAAGPIGASADATLETTVRLHEEVGSSTAFATGWTVRQIERELRTEVVEMAIPLFEADGSRTVTEGAPVFRILAQEQPVAYPVITIVDRCGNERTLRAPWTLTSKEKATDPRR
ncbi:MAG: hypothetical protein JNJ88_08665 [Planctomycetes bacterium]|nr:hypothetical protein [Planctomycetota bacterium]